MKKPALAVLEQFSPLLDRKFQRQVKKGFGAEELPANALLEPSWLSSQLKLPGHLPICVAYQRRPALRKANPHPLFDPEFYLANYPEASEHKYGPLGHFLETGEQGGCQPSALWRNKDKKLSQAIKQAHGFLTRRAVSSVDSAGTLETFLDWQDSATALAQAEALAGANWPHPLTVVLGDKFLTKQPGTGKAHLTPLERVQITSAIALVQALPDARSSFVQDLPNGPTQGQMATTSQLCLVVGRPSSRLLASAAEQLEQLGANPLHTLLDFIDPKASDPASPEWGELLIAPASLIQEVLVTRPESAAQLALDLVKTATSLGHSVAVSGMESGDEFALPNSTSLRRIHQIPSSLRWQLITPVTSSHSKTNWGDTWFAQDLAAALRDLGQQVSIDSQSSQSRPTAPMTDVRLVLRGKATAQNAKTDWLEKSDSLRPPIINIMWLISNPESVDDAEYAAQDLIFVASELFTQTVRDLGWPARTLLQCTNPERFHPVAESELSERVPPLLLLRLRQSVLFVGGARHGGRPVVTDARQCDAKLAVFGHGWAGHLSRDEWLGEHVDNQDLNYFYQAAQVVLADHEESMRRNGFVSNRIFDSAASGARVLCDALGGEKYLLEDLFGSSVRNYQDLPAMRGLLTDPQSGWPTEEIRVENAARIGQLHSFKARAQVLLDCAHELRASASSQPVLV